MNWKTRFWLVTTAVWLMIALAIATSEDSLTSFIMLGLFPITMIWGIAWAVKGFLSQRKNDTQHTNESAEKKYFNAKRFLIYVLIIVFAFAGANFYAGDHVYHLMGEWIAKSLFAYFVARVAIQKKLLAGMLSIGVFACGLVVSAYLYKQEEQKVLAEWRTVAPIFSEIQEGRTFTDEQIKAYNLGRLEPVVRAAMDAQTDMIALWVDYSAKIDSIGIKFMWMPSRLGTDTGRADSLRIYRNLEEAVIWLENTHKMYIEKTKTKFKLSTTNLPPAYSKHLIIGCNHGLNESDRLFKEFIKTQRGFCTLVKEMLLLVNRAKPVPIGKNLYFQNKRDLEQYQRISQDISSIIKEESSILQEAQQAQIKKNKKFLKIIEQDV